MQTVRVLVDKLIGKKGDAKKADDTVLGLSGGLTEAMMDILINSGDVSALKALQNFAALSEKKRKRHLVLIVGEANKVPGLGEGSNVPSVALDQQIVQLSKQPKQLTVIMTSSEHAHPCMLECNGLNLNAMSNMLFASEIPPKSMWDLLVLAQKKG